MSVSRPEATPERERPPSRELDEATPRLVLITDPVFGDEPIARCVRAVGRALPRGALCVQLRDKRRPVVSLRVFAWRLRAITREIGALLVVNGEPAVARDVGADGVHLGAGACGVAEAKAICGRGAFVSVAAHSDDEVRSAVRDGADAVLVSPVFSTRPPSAAAVRKPGRGVGAVRSAHLVARGRAAVYALGGVTPDNAGACVEAGARGVAVVRAVLGSAEPARAARALHDAVCLRC